MKKRSFKGRLIQVETGLVLTDLTLKPIACNKGAAVMLNGRNGPSSSPELPSRLPNQILEAIGDREPHDLSSAKITFRMDNNDYSCRTYLMEREDGAPAMVVLHIERLFSVLDSVHAVAQRCRLTEREHEVLEGVSLGLSSKEIAAKMKVSPNTIKVFVRLIMIKMGVTTRGGIVAQILQSQAEHGHSGSSTQIVSMSSEQV